MQACFAQRTRQAVKCESRMIFMRGSGYLWELVAPHRNHHKAEEVESAGVDGNVHKTEFRREVVSDKSILPSIHEAYTSPVGSSPTADSLHDLVVHLHLFRAIAHTHRQQHLDVTLLCVKWNKKVNMLEERSRAFLLQIGNRVINCSLLRFRNIYTLSAIPQSHYSRKEGSCSLHHE